MKNQLLIDMDTERTDSPVVIGKQDGTQPTNPQEWAEMINLDMTTLCEGLVTLIHAADQNGGRKSAESLRVCIQYLEQGFGDAGYSVDMPQMDKK